MRKKRTYVLAILILCAAVYLIGKVSLPYIFDWARGVDREYVKKMRLIKIGMTEQEVIKILGQPDGVITDPEVKETHGIYGSGRDYGKLVENRDKVLYYHHGMDYIGHYFIDENGKVYFLNVGGT
jgi:hypothetical protein